VKIGMLSQPGVIEAVADALVRHKARSVVLDPVMVATSGDRLINEDAIAALRTRLFPLATIVTPNMPEAAALLGEPLAQDEAAMVAQARRLMTFGAGAVLLKGGHADGPEASISWSTVREWNAWPHLGTQRATRTGPAAPCRVRSPPGWRRDTNSRARCATRNST
jgi:hydroxymethylpyrimidine/phosphomethylpyrimidine kinase